MTQEQFITAVDNLFIEHYELGVYDLLGDFRSWDMWNDGMSPQEAFEELRGEVEEQIDMMEELFK